MQNRFHLGRYFATLEAPSAVAAAAGLEGQVHRLVLDPAAPEDRDDTAVILDVLRAGYLVLSCRRTAAAYLLEVCRTACGI